MLDNPPYTASKYNVNATNRIKLNLTDNIMHIKNCLRAKVKNIIHLFGTDFIW